MTRRLLPLVALCALAACHTKPPPAAPDAAPERAHHRGGTFQNRYVEFETRRSTEFWRWKLDQVLNGLPPPPSTPIPSVAPDRAFVDANARAGRAMRPAVTWIGHSTTLVQVGGLNLVTDPVFSERVSPLSFIGPKRHSPPGLALAELPHVDVVLISHNHYDHLDDASVRALAKQAGGPPLFILPLGLKTFFLERDIASVIELDWWNAHRVAGPLGEVEFVLTPVQHWSGRGLNDRMQTLWGGYAVYAPDCHLFFSGDTAYSKDFVDIQQRYAAREAIGGGFDIALIAIGAYEPRWFMNTQHINPTEAVQIHLDIHAKQSIGIHWGTFELTDESLDAPPRDLADARRAKGVADDAFVVLALGETRKLPKRPGAPMTAALP